MALLETKPAIFHFHDYGRKRKIIQYIIYTVYTCKLLGSFFYTHFSSKSERMIVFLLTTAPFKTRIQFFSALFSAKRRIHDHQAISNFYPSYQNHGSVKNGFPPIVVTFQIQPFSAPMRKSRTFNSHQKSSVKSGAQKYFRMEFFSK